MPYIITTHRHLDDPTAEFLPDALPGVSRRAVTTLEEARAALRKIVVDSAFDRGSTEGYPHYEDIGGLIAESGGTVGPLPDGTVIEVRPHAWYEIATQAGIVEAGLLGAYAERDAEGLSAQKILAAFNAREAAAH